MSEETQSVRDWSRDPKMIVFDKDPDKDDTLSITGAHILAGYYTPQFDDIDIAEMEKEGWQPDGLRANTWTLPEIQGPFPPVKEPGPLLRMRRWLNRMRCHLRYLWRRFEHRWKVLIHEEEDYD